MFEPLTDAGSIHIKAAPDAVYAVISDVTRTGQWSPVCRECWWDEGEGPSVGSWITDRNVSGDREWQTRSQVVIADEPHAFEWSVGPGLVLWTYPLRGVDGGTELTESWEFTAAGQQFFADHFGDDAPTQVAERQEAARTGIPETLAAIKRVIEQG